MATKKNTSPNPVQPVTPPTMYLKSERDLMMQLFKNCHTGAQSQQIIDFYKKYVNPKFNGTISNCGGCGTGFMDKFKEVRDYVSKNFNLFVN